MLFSCVIWEEITSENGFVLAVADFAICRYNGGEMGSAKAGSAVVRRWLDVLSDCQRPAKKRLLCAENRSRETSCGVKALAQCGGRQERDSAGDHQPSHFLWGVRPLYFCQGRGRIRQTGEKYVKGEASERSLGGLLCAAYRKTQEKPARTVWHGPFRML